MLKRTTLSALLAGAAIAAGASSVSAATYVWSSGDYVPGVTSPNPLLAGDVLNILTGSNKSFDAVAFANQGTVSWQNGAIFFGNGATVSNGGLWDATGDNGLFDTSGVSGQFVNAGTFRKSGGLGTTTVANVGFTNSGVIDAQTGQISFTGGDAVFNAGSSFIGAGLNVIASNAAFNGAFSSSNLVFAAGTVTGTAAVLSGSAVWNAGTFTGDWTVTDGSTLTIDTGNNKTLNSGSLTNAGTVIWNNGALFFGDGFVVQNDGLWNATGDNSLIDTSGAAGQFVNTGTFRKSGGAGATTVGGVGFTNSGNVDAQTGTIRFTGGDAVFNAGTSFTGAGVNEVASSATFNGAFTASNLLLTAGTFTGGSAEMTGSATWNAGTITGDWTVTGGSTLTIATGNNKTLSGGALENDGTVAWADGALFFVNGFAVQNDGLWLGTGDNSLNDSSGAPGQFVNTGIFRKDGAAGVTTVGDVRFTNSGTVDARTGTIRFAGSDAVFNDGTSFTGAGVNEITGSTAFNGAISTTNLLFTSGTLTGTAAVLDGSTRWSASTLTGDWTVTSGSTLTAFTGNNKTLTGGSLKNDGTVSWTEGAMFFGNGFTVQNSGLWVGTGDNSLNDTSGAPGQFVNTGTFRKAGGTGATTVGDIRFTNSGTVDAQTGTIRFTGGDAVFNAGTSFTGAGVNEIASNAAFNGAIAAANLVFTSGTYSGGDAVLSGIATWNAGTFAGGWTIASGSTLTSATGNNRTFDAATFTNDGTLLWTGGAAFFANGSDLINNGTLDFTIDTSFNDSSGDEGSIVNNGRIVKSGGAGTTTLANGFALDNEGVIDVRSGTIALPTNFDNDGTLTGTGAFSLSGTLTNDGVIAPGAGAGTLTLNGNYLQTALGAFDVQLASSSLADLFVVNGFAQLGGALQLSCIASCSIADGDVFTILDSTGALSGTFASVTTSGFLNGFAYDVTYDYDADRVLLTVLDAGAPNAVPEPASWAMMIAGFALVGAGARRNRRVVLA